MVYSYTVVSYNGQNDHYREHRYRKLVVSYTVATYNSHFGCYWKHTEHFPKNHATLTPITAKMTVIGGTGTSVSYNGVLYNGHFGHYMKHGWVIFGKMFRVSYNGQF